MKVEELIKKLGCVDPDHDVLLEVFYIGGFTSATTGIDVRYEDGFCKIIAED